MNTNKLLGKIKWYKKSQGQGYINGADNIEYYFSINNCLNKEENFKSGDIVEFIPNLIGQEYALEVEKVKNGN